MKKDYIFTAVTLLLLPVYALGSNQTPNDGRAQQQTKENDQAQTLAQSLLNALKDEFYVKDDPAPESLEKTGSFKKTLDDCIAQARNFSEEVWAKVKENSNFSESILMNFINIF